MNFRITKKQLFIVAVCLFMVFGAQYYFSMRKLTVNYSNIAHVSVYRVDSRGIDKNSKPVSTIKSSGQTIKLRSGSYVVRFEADTNYQDRDVAVNLNQKHQTITYKPYFSSDKLASLLPSELPSIKQLISTQIPASSQYEVQPGKLYHLGEWYGTTLVYKGQDFFNADTLRLVAHKENNSWIIKTNPPNISLSRLVFTDIPSDILRSVNEQ